MSDLHSNKIRVLLVEDDEAVRLRLASALTAGPSIDLVDSAATLEAAEAAFARHVPDVLVTDLRLPDGNAISLIRAVRASNPETEIMVVSALADDDTVLKAVEAGATGYILKDSLPTDIITAVQDLVAGRSPISARIARTIIRRFQLKDEAGKPAPSTKQEGPALTPRETEILWGIAKGFSYNELAEYLGISRHTVPTYIKNIYRKLEVNSRSEAVFVAIQRKLINIVQ